MLIIFFLFKKQFLITKDFKIIEKWQNYIDNEFKKWALKNNINKITVKLSDKPDLIVIINDDEKNKIGIELTSVFPFIKLERGGDIFKHNENNQEKIKNDLIQKIMTLNLEEKIPKFKIINNKIVFPSNFNNFKDKKIIEEVITQVKDLEQITPIYFYPTYFKCPCDKPEHIETLVGYVSLTETISNNVKNKLSINNLESNLINTIKTKNEKLEKYYKQRVKNNVLLILVEKMFHFLVWFVLSRDGFSNYYGIKDECCINHYFNQLYSNIQKEKNHFDQTVIIYKNTNAIKHICIFNK